MELNLQPLSNAKIEAAYDALSCDDQITIDRLAAALINAIKERRTPIYCGKVSFGRMMALELLAKVGVWLNRNGT